MIIITIFMMIITIFIIILFLTLVELRFQMACPIIVSVYNNIKLHLSNPNNHKPTYQSVNKESKGPINICYYHAGSRASASLSIDVNCYPTPHPLPRLVFTASR